eukprot:m51a1_g10009 hypothetical protein (541) ;mRNA; r:6568-8681
MQESSAALCQGAAQRWEQNWSAPYAPACFGACTCREFCAEHGYPHSICCAMHPQSTRHAMIVYKGAWYATRAPATAMAVDSGDDNDNDDDGAQRQRTAVVALNAPAGAVEPTAPPQPPEPPEAAQPRGAPGRCEECVRRLQRLGAVEWLKTAEQGARVAQALREAEAVCQLFCQTPYICKIHVYPTDTRRDGPPRFRCPVPHDAAKIGGRHQEWFGFYCGKAECCNGKWFSREETHRRSRKPRVAKQVPQHALPDIPQTAPAPVALTNAEKEMHNELDSPDTVTFVGSAAQQRGHRRKDPDGEDGIELQALLPRAAGQLDDEDSPSASASASASDDEAEAASPSPAPADDAQCHREDADGRTAAARVTKWSWVQRVVAELLLRSAVLLLVVAGLACAVAVMAVKARPGSPEVRACLVRASANASATDAGAASLGYTSCVRCAARSEIVYRCLWGAAGLYGYVLLEDSQSRSRARMFSLYRCDGSVVGGAQWYPTGSAFPGTCRGLYSDPSLGLVAWHVSLFWSRPLSPLSRWLGQDTGAD